MKTKVKVHDVMTAKPVTVNPETKLIDCAKRMRNNKIGSLLIKEGNMVIGIITEDDFIRKVIAENISLETPVKEVMVKELVKIEPGKDIYDAIKTMSEHGIKQLPVVDDGKLIGILTWKDVLTVQPQLFDVFIEKAHVNNFNENEKIRGKCEICGFEKELHESNGHLVCIKCGKQI